MPNFSAFTLELKVGKIEISRERERKKKEDGKWRFFFLREFPNFSLRWNPQRDFFPFLLERCEFPVSFFSKFVCLSFCLFTSLVFSIFFLSLSFWMETCLLTQVSSYTDADEYSHERETCMNFGIAVLLPWIISTSDKFMSVVNRKLEFLTNGHKASCWSRCRRFFVSKIGWKTWVYSLNNIFIDAHFFDLFNYVTHISLLYFLHVFSKIKLSVLHRQYHRPSAEDFPLPCHRKKWNKKAEIWWLRNWQVFQNAVPLVAI